MISRRGFLGIAGMGIIVLYVVDIKDLLVGRFSQFRGYPTDFNAYLRIGEDGRVSFFTGKIEMGQGVVTSLPQMLAEELDVPLSSVDPVMGDTDLCPWDMGTFGSMSTRFFGPPMRKAAAGAKAVLKELASERLDVPVERLGTRDGTVFDIENPSTAVTYAELARGRRIERVVRGTVALDDPSTYTVCGVPTTRTDAVAKVTGRAQYTADVRVEGMLYARILRPPAHGATLTQVDTIPAEEVSGVHIVNEPDLVAVLHEIPDMADRALAEVVAQWDEAGSGPDNATIYDYLLADLPEAQTEVEDGNLDRGRSGATQRQESTFYAQYVAHAPMEPHAALVHIEGNATTVWASTQTPFSVKSGVAELLDCPEEDVRVITPFVGGGFGGKSTNTQALEAARLAKLTGRPVQVSWTREEEFFYDTFRPATIVRVESGIDTDSRLMFWDYANMHGSSRSSTPAYHIPNRRVTVQAGSGGRRPAHHPLAVGPWRGPGANVNHFAMESQIDIMAHAAGTDPLSFRLANLTDARMKRVVDTVAEHFGHEWTPAPSGRGYGLAIGTDAGTYVATMAEVRVNESTGEVRVLRMVCAQDMGEIVNPAGAKIQIEGCLIQGLGYTLAEEVRFDRGMILDQTFDSYQIPRFSWLPDIESVLVENAEIGPQGGGEPAITTVGAVVANAIFDATGARLYELPMTPARVRSAMAQA
jgi:CO/xanthine dehydrogenase Mo-binding subunit